MPTARRYEAFERSRNTRSPWLWVALGAALLLGSCAGIYALGQRGGSSARDQEQAAFDGLPATLVSPEQLIAAYAQSKAVADRTYKGQKIEISGHVEGVEAGLHGQPVVRLKGTDAFHSVNARDVPREVTAKLQAGARITLVCKGDGAIIDSPMLSDCQLK